MVLAGMDLRMSSQPRHHVHMRHQQENKYEREKRIKRNSAVLNDSYFTETEDDEEMLCPRCR